MTTARTWAVALTGVDGHLVEVEADMSNQTPEFRIIGLPDKSLGEAVQRVHNACKNAGLDLPRRRLTVNLSPASLPKHGAGFDLGIAMACLAAGGSIEARSIAATVHIGELGLDGRLHGRGVGAGAINVDAVAGAELVADAALRAYRLGVFGAPRACRGECATDLLRRGLVPPVGAVNAAQLDASCALLCLEP